MKTLVLALFALLLTSCGTVPPAPNVHRVNGVPVYQKNAEAKSGKQFIYTESPATPLHVLYTADQAKAILDEFKITYAKLGAPKLMCASIYLKAPCRCHRYPLSPEVARPQSIRPPVYPCPLEPHQPPAALQRAAFPDAFSIPTNSPPNRPNVRLNDYSADLCAWPG